MARRIKNATRAIKSGGRRVQKASRDALYKAIGTSEAVRICNEDHPRHVFHLIYHDDDEEFVEKLVHDIESLRLGQTLSLDKPYTYFRKRCGATLLEDQDDEDAILKEVITQVDMVVMILTPSLYATLQANAHIDEAERPAAERRISRLMMELSLVIGDDDKANKLVIVPFAPRESKDAERLFLPDIELCITAVQPLLRRLMSVQIEAGFTRDQTSEMAALLVKQWNRNHKRLAKLRSYRQEGFMRLREKMMSLQGRPIQPDCLVGELNTKIPINLTYKCSMHGCLFHSAFISYRVQASAHVARPLAASLERVLREARPVLRPRVFLDKTCLVSGQKWRDGFLNVIRSCHMIIILLTEDTLQRIRQSPYQSTDNVLLEWECALDLLEAQWIQIVVVSALPRPDRQAEGKAFLATIPDETTPSLREGRDIIRPRRTARAIMERLLQSDITWFQDKNLHAQLPMERDAVAAELPEDISSNLWQLALEVESKWGEFYSMQQQARRALLAAKAFANDMTGRATDLVSSGRDRVKTAVKHTVGKRK